MRRPSPRLRMQRPRLPRRSTSPGRSGSDPCRPQSPSLRRPRRRNPAPPPSSFQIMVPRPPLMPPRLEPIRKPSCLPPQRRVAPSRIVPVRQRLRMRRVCWRHRREPGPRRPQTRKLRLPPPRSSLLLTRPARSSLAKRQVDRTGRARPLRRRRPRPTVRARGLLRRLRRRQRRPRG
jgi:hypothetical protein